MTQRKSSERPREYGYQPKRNINEGYQPSEERGYQPNLTSSGTGNVQQDNPPSGGSSGQSSSYSDK